MQHCGRLRNAKKSNVNVSEDRIKEHFIKRFSKQNHSVSGKKGGGGRGPLGPSPKSAYASLT